MKILKHRLFFALWPEPSVRKAVVAAMEPLKPILAAQWIKPANLHITLAFLGEVEEERIALALAVADKLVSPGFELRLDTLEHWRKPQILCLSPSTPVSELAQLAATLSDNLQDAGFKLEKRAYRPHLTLARKAPHLPINTQWEKPIHWMANAFVLVESEQDAQGSRYSSLQAWRLSCEDSCA